MTCLCSAWSDRQRVPLGAETAEFLEDGFETIRQRNPWLRLVRCRHCGQHWYAALDTVDDDYYLLRVDGNQVDGIASRDEWPSDFDGFVNVWPDPLEPWRARLSWPWKDWPS
jgi:hypothetical protein